MLSQKLIGLGVVLWVVCCLTAAVTMAELAAAALADGPGSMTEPAPASSPAAAGHASPAAALDEEAVSSEAYFFSRNRLAELQLFIEDFSLRAYWRLSILKINSGRLFHDLDQALRQLATLSGFPGYLQMFGKVAALILIALLIDWAFRRFILRVYWKLPDACPLTGSGRAWMSLQQALPRLVSLLFFFVVAYGLYVNVYSSYFSTVCPTYLSVMVIIVTVRLAMILMSFFVAPENAPVRLFKVDDSGARNIHLSATLFVALVVVGAVTYNLLKYGGLEGDSLLLVRLFFGTLLIASTGLIIFLNHRTIAFLQAYGSEATGYLRGAKAPLATSWYWLLGLYLLIVWLIWANRLVLFEMKINLAFFLSLLVVPIFLLLDTLTIWLLRTIRADLADGKASSDGGQKVAPPRPDPGKLHVYLRTLRRLLLAGLLLLWVVHLWGFSFDFSESMAQAMRKMAMVFVIFFIIWQIIDKSVESMLAKTDEIGNDHDDDTEGEWGGGKLLDRRQTLLPIVRKFLGIVVLVLYVLFTLSSLGINIGPLLAGAGVMGIAIGFGAQKLVSDLLSGFFFLIDDAFRVGEYIEAGSVTGTVERITLRNLMLRHHRGMLQIIPYSDLGAVTNFMRGGIVVKFNLQFSYDTDVEQVRKVIKRVGQEMLIDPELGKNFIKQMKSQGIREVGDSVFTIRIKFTAKPGTHFVIRREAYRRITEGLNAKGIYYAHRKIIVDLPEETRHKLEGDARTRVLEAGAAAALATEQKQPPPGEAEKDQ